jgi:hypothetical protein
MDDIVEIPEDFVGTIINFRLRQGEYFDKEGNKWQTKGSER